jgi:hypothetical protein
MLHSLLLSLAVSSQATAAGSGNCPDAGVIEAADAATEAFASLDPNGFADARKLAHRALACSQRQLTPEEVARLQELEALAAFLAKDADRTRAAFRAARRASVTYKPTPSVAPGGGPIDRIYLDAMEEAPSVLVRVYADDGDVYVDGVPATEVALEHPSVVQLAENGPITTGTWIPEGTAAELPEWLSLAPPAAATLPARQSTDTVAASPGRELGSDPAPARLELSRPMWITAGTLSVIAGGLWVAFGADVKQYNSDKDDYTSGALKQNGTTADIQEAQADVNSQAQRINTVGSVAVGVSGLAGACAGVAIAF